MFNSWQRNRKANSSSGKPRIVVFLTLYCRACGAETANSKGSEKKEISFFIGLINHWLLYCQIWLTKFGWQDKKLLYPKKMVPDSAVPNDMDIFNKSSLLYCQILYGLNSHFFQYDFSDFRSYLPFAGLQIVAIF